MGEYNGIINFIKELERLKDIPGRHGQQKADTKV